MDETLQRAEWGIGYFAYNHYRMPAMQDIFGQMWKEYSLSDSRYLTSDPFVLCMESITAVCAIRPLSPICHTSRALTLVPRYSGDHFRS